VTIRASGLFRDLFPAQLALFALAVDRVAARDEDDEWNPLAAARRRGAATDRAFAGAPGTYGAGTAALALDSDWAARDELGRAYLAATTHAYGPNEEGREAPQEFADRVAAADALIHVQDDEERDLLDGDGVADAMGGFAAAAKLLGAAPALYHLDTSKPDAPRARTAAEAVARVVRGRLANPRWISGMLAHGHRGAAEIAQGVDALFAFAATTDAVGNPLFELVQERVVADPTVRDALLAANPDAAAAIAARLQDAIARGLWKPRRNAVHAELEMLLPKVAA
jgi:cobaltochelatase CobN